MEIPLKGWLEAGKIRLRLALFFAIIHYQQRNHLIKTVDLG
jgi:hypothetical protein